jgi:hypothetical protein
VNRVFVLAPGEDWIVDRFVKEWNEDNADISVTNPQDAEVIWLLADWCAGGMIMGGYCKGKKVITTVHHIVPEKFNTLERYEFAVRDAATTVYHVYNQHTYDFIRPLTKKPIHLIQYWANQRIWRQTGAQAELRKKHGLPVHGYLIGSFQRDTEGHDLKSPKLEKGPDLFCDFVESVWNMWDQTNERNAPQPKTPHVVLAGWRRQYVISRLEKHGVPYTYFERPPQETINELYQTLSVYPVTARQEGGPQSLIECGLLGVPVVSRPVGIAEQVLPPEAINDKVIFAGAAVPNVDSMKLPDGYKAYRDLIQSL